MKYNMTIRNMIHTIPKLHINIELWKWNTEINLYVSNQGRLKSATGVIVQPKVDKYLSVCKLDGKWTNVHRLVMKTFNPVDDMEHMTVDHLNHNTHDNRLENLEWVTEEENLKRAEQDYRTPTPMQNSNEFISTVFCPDLNRVMTVEEAAEFLLTTSTFSNNKEPQLKNRIMTNIWNKAQINANTTSKHSYANYRWYLSKDAYLGKNN